MRHYIRYRHTLRRQRRFVFSKVATNEFIVGDAQGIASVSGTLVADGLVVGSSSGTASVSGILRGKGYLDGSIAGTAIVDGTLAEPGDMEGSVSSTATVTGTLVADGRLAGVAFGTGSVSGILAGDIDIAGTIAGTSTVSGILVAVGTLSGTVSGTSTATATIAGSGYLSGISIGTVVVSATADIPEIAGEGVPVLSAGIWRKSQPNTILFVLVDTNGDEVIGLGGTFTLQISKIGGVFSASAGTKSEIGLGWYKYISTISEANTSGPVAIVVTHASIDQQNLEYVVEDRVVTAIEFTYTLTSSVGSIPISGADVSFSTDSDPQNTIWSGITDAFGVARDLYGNLPRLDPGAYTIFSNKPGFVFETDQETVN